MPEITTGFITEIKQTIHEWASTGRPGEMLYQGEKLVTAKEWARRNSLNRNEWAFVEACILAENNPLGAVIRRANHDIRGVLNNIIGYSDLLLDELEGKIDEMSFEDLRSIHSSAGQLLDLSNDFMDFAKLQSSLLEFSYEYVSIPECLDEAQERLRKHSGQRTITVERVIPVSLPDAFGDQQRIVQLLYNLLFGSTLLLNSEMITIEMQKVGDVIRVSLSAAGTHEKFLDLWEHAVAFQLAAHFVRAQGGTISYVLDDLTRVNFTLPTSTLPEDRLATTPSEG
jgi:hypothetical protein